MRERQITTHPIALTKRKKYNKPAGSQKHYFLAYVLWRKYRKRFAEPVLEDYGYGSDRPNIPAPLDTAVSPDPVHAGRDRGHRGKSMRLLPGQAA